MTLNKISSVVSSGATRESLYDMDYIDSKAPPRTEWRGE